MPYEIITVNNKFVKCYLVKTGDSYFMVDTGLSICGCALKNTLQKAGCTKDNLKCIVITHGDWDHTGSGAYLQKAYGVKIIAHKNEVGALERGDMNTNRKNKRSMLLRIFLGMFRFLFFRPLKSDIYIEGDQELKDYGIDARIIYIPGHSLGSIGVVTKDGDLFCGDLLNNSRTPEKNTLVDDTAEMDASIEHLKTLNIKTVYPGHGKPFKMEELNKKNPR